MGLGVLMLFCLIGAEDMLKLVVPLKMKPRELFWELLVP